MPLLLILYVLDHADVAREIICRQHICSSLWEGWLRILIAMQAMNAHERRTLTHVEFANPAWGNALTLHTDLMSKALARRRPARRPALFHPCCPPPAANRRPN